MILDERTEFCDATSLNTGAAASYLIGDVIDTTLVSKDLGNGAEDLFFVVQVDTAVTGGGGCTVQFHLASDAQAAIAVDGSATYHISTSAIAVATLIAGYTAVAAKLPVGTYERYVGVLQTTGTAAVSAGKVNAFLTPEFAKWQAYADAI
jgi:hypothetical protein